MPLAGNCHCRRICDLLVSVAIIHDTTLVPSKLDLLTAWLPRQPWFRGASGPDLVKAGGFRIDDPAGEVGIEMIFVIDTADPRAPAYVVPMTYRGAPLAGSDGLIGTSEHGVLGRRYFYDAPTDPVFCAQLSALGRGEVVAQHQDQSNVADDSVHRSGTGDQWRLVRVPDGVLQESGQVSALVRHADGTTHRATIAIA